MNISKINSETGLKGLYSHNYRMYTPKNVDPSLTHLNKELVSLDGDTYLMRYKKIIEKLPYYKTHKVRKNAVMAIPILLKLNREDAKNVDVKKWQEDSLNWIRENFNESPNVYGENLVSAMYHADEAGDVHIHALVIPIDKNGKLNASAYIDGPKDLSRLQRSYSDYMNREIGLKKIEPLNGIPRYKDIKNLYSDIKTATNELNELVRKNFSKNEFLEEAKKIILGYVKRNNDLLVELKKERSKTAGIEHTLEAHFSDTVKTSQIIEDIEKIEVLRYGVERGDVEALEIQQKMQELFKRLEKEKARQRARDKEKEELLASTEEDLKISREHDKDIDEKAYKRHIKNKTQSRQV